MRQTVQMDYFFSHTKKHSVSQVAFLKKLELQDGVMIMERWGFTLSRSIDVVIMKALPLWIKFCISGGNFIEL